MKKFSLNPVKFAMASLMAGSLVVSTGCSTLGGFFGKKDKDDIVSTADSSEEQYYQKAQEYIAKSYNNEAAINLNNIRTFYPTGKYAQQALLDLIYVYYQSGNYEAVINSTEEFIRLYPTSPHLDYALYVQGVTNMGGAPKASRFFITNQSQRNTAYLRLAFNDFQSLVYNFPSSPYAADAAQRMIALYNDFAENELVAARWYIKRDAMVSAANRAKWVFQYYPQSQAVPEAIAILAYANQKLGLQETANQYKTLLQINYPHYLNQDGSVRLSGTSRQSSVQKLLSTISFGKFGQAKNDKSGSYQGQYTQETRKQLIRQANNLTLPQAPQADSGQTSETNESKPARRPLLNLGLPEAEASAGHLNDTPR